MKGWEGLRLLLSRQEGAMRGSRAFTSRSAVFRAIRRELNEKEKLATKVGNNTVTLLSPDELYDRAILLARP
jgi:hypothetical protein